MTIEELERKLEEQKQTTIHWNERSWEMQALANEYRVRAEKAEAQLEAIRDGLKALKELLA